MLASFHIQVPQNGGRQCCSIFLPLIQLPDNDTPNLSATSGFISLTIIYNIDSISSSDPTLRLLHTHGIPFSSGLENGDAGSIVRRVWLPETDIYFWQYPLWIDDFRERFYLFLSPDSLGRSISDTPKHHRQSSSEDIRLQPMPYTIMVTMSMAPAPLPTVTFRWRQYSNF